MNIDDYRALKAEQDKAPEVTQPVQDEPKAEVITEGETQIEETKVETKAPELTDTFTIDGQEVTLEELQKGYLRQSDYTKKTQEISRQRKEAETALELYNRIQSNPELINNDTGEMTDFDPSQIKYQELEAQLYDMKLEREIDALSAKYEDFDVVEALNIADEKSMTNLEDAYFIGKALRDNTKETVTATKASSESTDFNSMREQIKQELLQELQKENVSTRSLISTGGSTNPAPKQEARISEAEKKVANGMGMSVTEYVKWRDADNK